MNTADSQSKSPRWQAFVRWLEPRTGLASAVEACRTSESAGRGAWWNVWMSMTLCALVMQAVTGFFLWLHYSPSAQTAWESVYYLQYEVTGGWLCAACTTDGPDPGGLAGGVRGADDPAGFTALRASSCSGRTRAGPARPGRCASPATCSPGTRTATPAPRPVSFSCCCRGSANAVPPGDWRPGLLAPMLTRFFALHVGCAAGFIGIFGLHAWLPIGRPGPQPRRGRDVGDRARETLRHVLPDPLPRLACLALLVLSLLFVFWRKAIMARCRPTTWASS